MQCRRRACKLEERKPPIQQNLDARDPAIPVKPRATSTATLQRLRRMQGRKERHQAIRKGAILRLSLKMMVLICSWGIG
jgi:hypothetical protein